MNQCWGPAKINGGNYQHYLFVALLPLSVTSFGPGPVIVPQLELMFKSDFAPSVNHKIISHPVLFVTCGCCGTHSVFLQSSHLHEWTLWQEIMFWRQKQNHFHVIKNRVCLLPEVLITFFFFFGGDKLLCQWLLKLLQFNFVPWQKCKNTFLREKQMTYI